MVFCWGLAGVATVSVCVEVRHVLRAATVSAARLGIGIIGSMALFVRPMQRFSSVSSASGRVMCVAVFMLRRGEIG